MDPPRRLAVGRPRDHGARTHALAAHRRHAALPAPRRRGHALTCEPDAGPVPDARPRLTPDHRPHPLPRPVLDPIPPAPRAIANRFAASLLAPVVPLLPLRPAHRPTP